VTIAGRAQGPQLDVAVIAMRLVAVFWGLQLLLALSAHLLPYHDGERLGGGTGSNGENPCGCQIEVP
jgi:hypothetical protein